MNLEARIPLEAISSDPYIAAIQLNQPMPGSGPTAAQMAAEVSLAEINMNSEEHKRIYQAGEKMRRRVVGDKYVNQSLESVGDFSRPLIQFATESAWGTIWTRPGLSLRDRSLLNLGMLTALNKWTELGTHIKGAIRNGCTEVEIREALLQASAYCGLPAGMEAFRVAEKVLDELGEERQYYRCAGSKAPPKTAPHT